MSVARAVWQALLDLERSAALGFWWWTSCRIAAVARVAGRSFVVLAWLVSIALLSAHLVGVLPAAAAEDPGSSASLELRPAPPTFRSSEQHPLWSGALALEEANQLAEAALRYEQIASEVPSDAHSYWRVARNYWRIGEDLPLDAKEERLEYFALARAWADRGIEVDDACSECMLWKFSSIGREATTTGIVGAMYIANDLEELIEEALRLKSDHVDNADNATMGNILYAASSFYRVVPDWWWLRWVIGVRGDKERSLEYIREAVALSKRRIDYRLELGAVLTCLGVVKDDEKRLEEGAGVLTSIAQMEHIFPTDAIDAGNALTLLGQPDLACGYSRDGFIEISSPSVEVSYDDFNRTMKANGGKIDANVAIPGAALPAVSAEPDASDE